MRWAHPEKLHRAIPRSQIPAARFSLEAILVACTCCPERSAIGHRRRTIAAALPPAGPARQEVQRHFAHPSGVVRTDPESKTESRDLERVLEETIPACGSHREKAFDKRNLRALSCLRCREE